MMETKGGDDANCSSKRRRSSLIGRGSGGGNGGGGARTASNNNVSAVRTRRRRGTRASARGERKRVEASPDDGNCSDFPSDAADFSLRHGPDDATNLTSNLASNSECANDCDEPLGKRSKNDDEGGDGVSVTVTQSAAKTLFSAVMSRSNAATPRSADGAGEGVETPDSYAENDHDENSLDRTPTTRGDVAFLQKIGTPTLQNRSDNNRWGGHRKSPQKSPMSSPGGLEILRALDDANDSYGGYYRGQDSDATEEDAGDGDGHPAEEWHDAEIRFRHASKSADDERRYQRDLTDLLNAEGEFHPHSTIVEATKFATDMKSDAHPEPSGVGFVDWSLKRRLRLECVPGRCLPGISSRGTGVDEGLVHRLAMLHLSEGGGGESRRRRRGKEPSAEESASARWLAGTMYYQHPAVHPLPPGLLEESRSNERSRTRGRDLSSSLQGPRSVHDRVRRPAAGCMGGLGASVPPDRKGRPATATASSLMDQRRRDWQEAFRSMFRNWRSRLRDLEGRAAEDRGGGSSSSERSMQDELSRCSFYSVLPHQIILFRGGYSGGNGDRIVPVISFSSTSTHLRWRLRSMGVDLRLSTRRYDRAVRGGGGGSAEDVFSEDLLNPENVRTEGGRNADAEGDAESVRAELDAIKWADDERGKVTVERKRRRAGRDPGGTAAGGRGADLPPLYVRGEDDCAVVYELVLNTYGLSIDLGPGPPKAPGMNRPPSDVPLLLCRSLGQCAHAALRTLCVSSRRDGGQQSPHERRQQQGGSSSSSARAALELRGPMLPCALRDLTCAMVEFMLLDESKLAGRQNRSSSVGRGDVADDDDGSASSHQFAMFLQAHEGERPDTTSGSTGSSSSLRFNGSEILLSPGRDEGRTEGESSTAWRECKHGDFVNVLVWDVSRKHVISFNPLSAKTRGL